MGQWPRSMAYVIRIPTSWGGTDELGCSLQGDRFESLRIVGTDRGANDKEQGLIWRCDPKSPLGPD